MGAIKRYLENNIDILTDEELRNDWGLTQEEIADFRDCFGTKESSTEKD